MPNSGIAVPRNQAWPHRAPLMEKLFRQAFGNRPVKAVEVGVWYGIGSTNIWLEALGKGSEIFLVDSWAPYASEADLNDPGWDYGSMDKLATDAFLSSFLNVKKFENDRADRDVKITLMRGDSSSILPSLISDYFDFVYIDGDHKYEKMKSDLIQAKRLVNKQFGIICGDDLEKIPTQELYEYSKKFRHQDYLREPHNFHPGVLMGVFEEFPFVNMANGFWWVACVDSEFVPFELAERPSNGSDLTGAKAEPGDTASSSDSNVDVRIAQLEAELAERDALQKKFNIEITRAESQIELIKDLLLRESDV